MGNLKSIDMKKIFLFFLLILIISLVVLLASYNAYVDVMNAPSVDTNWNNYGDNKNNLNVGVLYSIDSIAKIQNNFFKYDEFKFSIKDGMLVATDGVLTNLTSYIQYYNLNINLYDNEKNLIVSKQVNNSPIIDTDDIYWESITLNPGRSAMPSFSIYIDNVIDGYSLNDAAYYSIENIKF